MSNQISESQFQNIKMGMLFYASLHDEIIAEIAATDAYWNSDADEPGWEIIAQSGMTYHISSVLDSHSAQCEPMPYENVLAILRKHLNEPALQATLDNIMNIRIQKHMNNYSDIAILQTKQFLNARERYVTNFQPKDMTPEYKDYLNDRKAIYQFLQSLLKTERTDTHV